MASFPPHSSSVVDHGTNSNPTSSPPLAPAIPLDIMHIVLDILSAQGDMDTVKSCSLVSRALLSPVRRHLFGTIRLSFSPSSTIHYIARRIIGLHSVLSRNPDLGGFIRTLYIIDTHPVSETDQWLTRMQFLPEFLLKLHAVRSFTFGCDVGMIDWEGLGYELKMALFHVFHSKQIESIRLCQIRDMAHEDAVSATRRARKLFLDRVHVRPEVNMLVKATTVTRLFEIRVHSVRQADTHSAWAIIRHTPTVWRRMVWRCWEDPQDPQGFSLPGTIDLSHLPRLSQLYFKLSMGKYARDLKGCISVLDTASATNSIKEIYLSVVFPYPFQATSREWNDILSCTAWRDLQKTLLRRKFAFLSKVVLELTVNYGRRRDWRDITAQFRSLIAQEIPELAKTTRFYFQIRVDTFGSR
ncbi:hypothetical protein BDQ17DRAFT_1430619 [Cyathus striatus]|nr:hypothetical protein BDQ17DRAFT_1430619 [Cyathus striatus]